MHNAAREKSFDNLTIVMVAFKGLYDYLSKKGDHHLLSDTLNENNKNIKIQEGESNNLHGNSHNQSNEASLKRGQTPNSKGFFNNELNGSKKFSVPDII